MAGEGALAGKIRTGLTVVEGGAKKGSAVDVLDELFYRRPVRQHVREFGALFGLILLVLASFKVWRGHNLALGMALTYTGGLLYLVGAKFPKILYPVWESWMALAEWLNIVVTFVLMSVTWVLMVTPISFIVKMVGAQRMLMDTSFKTSASSYWEVRDPKENDFKLLERQY